MDETYEFIGTSANVHTVDLFVQCMYRAMYERKYKQTSSKASDDDLQEFVWKYVNMFYVRSGRNRKLKY